MTSWAEIVEYIRLNTLNFIYTKFLQSLTFSLLIQDLDICYSFIVLYAGSHVDREIIDFNANDMEDIDDDDDDLSF